MSKQRDAALTEMIPDRLMGTRVSSTEDLYEITQTILGNSAGLGKSGIRYIAFENSGDIIVYETLNAPVPDLVVSVPLPYLHVADTTTTELESALQLLVPSSIKLTVEVAPPPKL